jgi:hypothetical protein
MKPPSEPMKFTKNQIKGASQFSICEDGWVTDGRILVHKDHVSLPPVYAAAHKEGIKGTLRADGGWDYEKVPDIQTVLSVKGNPQLMRDTGIFTKGPAKSYFRILACKGHSSAILNELIAWAAENPLLNMFQGGPNKPLYVENSKAGIIAAIMPHTITRNTNTSGPLEQIEQTLLRYLPRGGPQ